LLSFQSRWMNSLKIDDKVQLCLPYLQSAGLVKQNPDADEVDRIKRVIVAASDRIKVAGDVLDYDDFFTADEELKFSEVDVEKRLRGDSAALGYLSKYRQTLVELPSFDSASLEESLNKFMEAEGIKFKQIIHALRVAVTGKSVGFGMFDAMAIIGKPSCLARIDRALALSIANLTKQIPRGTL
jgi:glutamyl-tRNA synthetase